MSKSSRYEMDMTKGPLLPQIIVYTLPLILTSLLQLLYNAADIVVVGRFAGTQALAAVSSTGSLINLLVNLFMGLSVGASVVIANNYGAADYQGVHKSEHTAIALALFSGIFVGIIGFAFAKPLLRLMGNPDDVIDQSTLYLKIYFLGMPANMLYNFGAATLRAVGDTRHPLYYLTISGIVNVILNLVLVIVFHLGVAGVAIATVISQIISMVLVLICLVRSSSVIKLNLRELKVHKEEAMSILRVGLPAGLQSCLFSISNVIIQSSVNSFGSIAMAGSGAASNLEGFAYAVMNCVYQADMTFASQNYGAKNYKRVKKVLWVSLGIVVTAGLGVCMLFLLFSRPLLSIYNNNPDVIEWGIQRMKIILPTYFICGMMDTTVGQLRGCGYSVGPMIASLLGVCGIRIFWIFTVFAAHRSFTTLFLSYPISWAATLIFHLVTYLALARPKLDRLEAVNSAK